MPETKPPIANTLVIGAGELGLAVISGLLKQNLGTAKTVTAAFTATLQRKQWTA